MKLIGSLLALIASLALVPCAFAETVRFPSATTPPTPLQQRMAQERGQPVSVSPGTELMGELYSDFRRCSSTQLIIILNAPVCYFVDGNNERTVQFER